MYYPYLRSKQQELSALKEVKSIILNNKNITPVVELINYNKRTKKFIREAHNDGLPIIYIINSKLISNDEILAFLEYTKDLEIKKGLILDNINLSDNNDIYFQNDLNSDDTVYVCFQQTATTERILSEMKQLLYILNEETISDRLFADLNQNAEVVMMNDHFKQANRNADYPESEYFSEDFKVFKSKRYNGFCDFQMIGNKICHGGPAHAVALHWTYKNTNDEIWINHFISNDTETTANVQGKYLQALTKLVDFFEEHPNFITTEAQDKYRNNLETRKYHGLGYPKKVSIENHLELMSKLLSNCE